MSVQQAEGEKHQGKPTPAGGIDLHDLAEYSLLSFQEYAKTKPQAIALCCLGIGFVLGWKLKPW